VRCDPIGPTAAGEITTVGPVWKAGVDRGAYSRNQAANAPRGPTSSLETPAGRARGADRPSAGLSGLGCRASLANVSDPNSDEKTTIDGNTRRVLGTIRGGEVISSDAY
jgi:hypothetical protein